MSGQLLSAIALCVVIGIVQASIGLGDDFYTKPIRAKFDEDTVITTTHAEAREIGNF